MKTSVQPANGERSECDAVIGIGCRVEVELIEEMGNVEPMTFDLAPEGGGDLAAGFVAADSALGKAVLGRRAGETVDYHVADVAQVRILTVVTGRAQEIDPAASREAVIKEALQKSDLADAVRLSLTVDQKWGDTDPTVMAENWDKT
jgi:hypothetical protein